MSTLRVNTLQNTSGVEVYTAKAWVNFNGTGTVAIRAAGNVSSITDNGTGNYTVNFTTAMVDANYSAVATAWSTAATVIGVKTTVTSTATSSAVVQTAGNSANADSEIVSVAIFR